MWVERTSRWSGATNLVSVSQAYGLAWARNIRTEEAIRRLRTDEHSPTRYRVIGPLSNSEDFAAAFGCKKGVDPMARSDEERCEIW